jgi:hypothetical protein
VSAAQALQAARTVGVDLRLDGDDLMLEASAPPPAAILELLWHHKPGISVLLRPDRDGWTAEDWQVFLDERAGIAEFDGSVPRLEAEARAFACCVVEWLKRNFIRAVAAIKRAIRCFPMASNRPAMPGCIRAAGPHGMPGASPRLSPPWR